MKFCAASCMFLAFFMLIHVSVAAIVIRKKCPKPLLSNGRGREKSRGSTVRYRCNQSFQLFGEKYATCIRGNWDAVPICVKSGCATLPALKNGQIIESYRGAVAKFQCNPGYALFGSSLMYCDGAVWNGSIPDCKASEKMAQTWCNFESQDLCGWTQDPHHVFDWRRQNFQTPSGNRDTGPSFDHTLGPDRGGYYMFIESSSPRVENDTARLYSPVYTSQLTASQPSCFIFWYHMYGATTGSLNMYIKPENSEFGGALLPRFTKFGDQGNQWYQAIVLLPSMNQSFQVIIEAVCGAGYVSDTAIDDVKIANGSECLATVTNVFSPTESVKQKGDGNEIYDNTQSCRLRCTSTNFALTHTIATATGTPIFAECECHVGCLQTATCCPDYASYCMLGVTKAQKLTKSVSVGRSYHTPPPLPPLPPFPSAEFTTAPASTKNFLTFKMSSELPKPLENTEVPTIYYKPIRPPWPHEHKTEESNKPIPIPTDPTFLVLKPPTAIYIPKKSSVVVPRSNKTTVRPTTTTITPPSTLPPLTVSQRLNPVVTELNKTVVTKSVNIITTIKTIPTASKKLPLPTVPIHGKASSNSTTLLVPQQSFSTVKPTPPVTRYSKVIQLTKKPLVMSIPPVTEPRQTSRTSTTLPPLTFNQSTTSGKTQDVTEELKHSESTTRIPRMKVTRGEKWIQARRGPEPRKKDFLSMSMSGIVGILVAVILVITAVAIATYFVVRNRRRERRQNCMADDSDVRFLTSDEALDFSLARPADSNDDYL